MKESDQETRAVLPRLTVKEKKRKNPRKEKEETVKAQPKGKNYRRANKVLA